MTQSATDRITQLEIQLAHTQRMCEQLNEVVTGLSIESQNRGRLLTRLVEQVKDLKSKLEGTGSIDDERPPHY